MQSESAIWDILVALKKITMTVELLKDTKVGVTLNDTRKKFPAGNRVHEEAKDIIALWKKQCNITPKPGSGESGKGTDEAKQSDAKVSTKESSSSSTSSADEKAEKPSAADTAVADSQTGSGDNATEEDDDDMGVDELYDALDAGRKKVSGGGLHPACNIALLLWSLFFCCTMR
jgi:TFIIS helical bundle-like domain